MTQTKVAIYCRVSTEQQNTQLQMIELEQYAKTRDWQVAGIYEEKISGTTSNRPHLKRLLADSRENKFDVVLVWKLDRFARSLKDLLNLLGTLEEQRTALVSVKDQIDLSTPSGRLMVQLIGAFAEFEASLIRERVRAGLANARRSGKKLGRRLERDDNKVRTLRAQGYSIRGIATALGVTKASVQRSLAGCTETLPQVV